MSTYNEVPETKKCPFCAEEIKYEAIICRFCGHTLSNGSPQELNQKRKELSQQLADLEKNLAGWEHFLQEQHQIAQNSGGIGTRIIWIIVGLFLTPFLIGIPIIILAIIDILARGAKRSQAESKQSQARESIEIIKKQIADIKAEQSISN